MPSNALSVSSTRRSQVVWDTTDTAMKHPNYHEHQKSLSHPLENSPTLQCASAAPWPVFPFVTTSWRSVLVSSSRLLPQREYFSKNTWTGLIPSRLAQPLLDKWSTTRPMGSPGWCLSGVGYKEKLWYLMVQCNCLICVIEWRHIYLIIHRRLNLLRNKICLTSLSFRAYSIPILINDMICLQLALVWFHKAVAILTIYLIHRHP